MLPREGVCAASKGMVFAPFWFENGYQLLPNLVWIRLWFSKELREYMNVCNVTSVRRFIPSCKPGWKFAFQAHASFGGKSHSFPDREAFDLILMSTLTWITHGERARGRDKNKGDQFLWSGRENPSNCWRRGEFRITWTLRTLSGK